MKIIAHFHSPFSSKFGIPKQSGIVSEMPGQIVFEPPFRDADYLRGLQDFDYIWLLWEFSANKDAATSPLVRPPVLGGNEKRGVFATRSPFRPNPIGLSSVRIKNIEWKTPQGPIIHTLGADLMDATPIFDIKPYLPFADCHPEARSGFAPSQQQRLEVTIDEATAALFSADQLSLLRETLALDPRPHFHDDPQRIYGMPFYGHDIHFRVEDGRVITLS